MATDSRWRQQTPPPFPRPTRWSTAVGLGDPHDPTPRFKMGGKGVDSDLDEAETN